MEAYLPLLLGYLFIFAARVIDMSLDVLRILMLMRGRRLLASLIGFAEVAIFVVALNEVLKGGLTDPGKIIAYAGGFATGNYIGSLVEERLALGFLTIQIFPPRKLVEDLTRQMRNAGFGVTSVLGQGRDGDRFILWVWIKRKNLKKAMAIINDICPQVFFNISDTRSISGGVFPYKKGK